MGERRWLCIQCEAEVPARVEAPGWEPYNLTRVNHVRHLGARWHIVENAEVGEDDSVVRNKRLCGPIEKERRTA